MAIPVVRRIPAVLFSEGAVGGEIGLWHKTDPSLAARKDKSFIVLRVTSYFYSIALILCFVTNLS